jgi:trehalose/maltose hydrolase-like predicted phosphorylase
MNTSTVELDTGASTWHVVEDRFVPSLASGRESIFTIGNGYLSTRGSFEERTPGEVRATFIQGLFVTPPGELPLLGAVPDWTEVAMTFDGHPFGSNGALGGYRRSLDLKRGILEREVLWRAAETGVVKIRFRRLVSMAQPHLAALEVTLTALTNQVALWLETGIDTAVPSPSFPVWNPVRWTRPAKSNLRLDADSVDGAHHISVETSVTGPGRLEMIRDPHHHRFASQTILAVGRPVTFTKFTVYHSSRDAADPGPPPGLDTSFDKVAGASGRAWAKRWKAATIDIDGDPIAERGVRFAAFQVIGASPARDTGAAVGAKLASGFGYRHHVFWDTDIFIVPYLTVTLPDLARNHLGYRYRGLEGARRKAKRYGREGAFYAWESADTGDEVTPEWTSPAFGPPSRIWTGEIEEHITSDVAYAACNYWRWTGDNKFVRDEGMEMIVEGARYWASRLQVEPSGAHIRGVIGPDEYHSHVDDSLYTNLLAQWHMRAAADLVDRAGSAVKGRLGVSPTEPGAWRRLANQIVLLERADGVWEQHAGFFDLEPLSLSNFSPRHRSMYDLLGEERAERTQIIKQADVVMAMTLLPDAVGTRARRKRNWDYYVERCDHGSSLSMAVHARVAADLGLGQEAYDMFRAALAIDLEDVMGNARDGLHAATQGGILQATIFGFAGLRLEADEPVLRPHLPDNWDRIGFSFFHRGKRFERELTGTKVRKRKVSPPTTTKDKEERV